jgi:hypothetical protein
LRFTAAIGIVAVALTSLGSAATSRAETPDVEVSLSLAAVASRYKLAIRFESLTFPEKTTHGDITGSEADKRDLKSYTPLFVEEFSRYPPAFVKAAGLKRIVLCTDLAFAGQVRNAIPDFEHDTLYLDVRRGNHAPDYQRKVIHHEFYHLVDFKDDGRLYEDADWSALNPADFKYGPGGAAVQDQPETSVLTAKHPGFLNHYSTTGVEEDKADLFANLIVEPKYVAARARNEAVLALKVELLKSQLKQFCPNLDAAFWKAIDTRAKPAEAPGKSPLKGATRSGVNVIPRGAKRSQSHSARSEAQSRNPFRTAPYTNTNTNPNRRRVPETPGNRRSNFIADVPNRILQPAAIRVPRWF